MAPAALFDQAFLAAPLALSVAAALYCTHRWRETSSPTRRGWYLLGLSLSFCSMLSLVRLAVLLRS